MSLLDFAPMNLSSTNSNVQVHVHQVNKKCVQIKTHTQKIMQKKLYAPCRSKNATDKTNSTCFM